MIFFQTLNDLSWWVFLMEYAPHVLAVLMFILQSQYTVPLIGFLKARFSFIDGRVTQYVSAGLALLWGVADVVVAGGFSGEHFTWATVFAIGSALFAKAEAQYRMIKDKLDGAE